MSDMWEISDNRIGKCVLQFLNINLEEIVRYTKHGDLCRFHKHDVLQQVVHYYPHIAAGSKT